MDALHVTEAPFAAAVAPSPAHRPRPRRRAPPGPATPTDALMRLQRLAGNGAVQRLVGDRDRRAGSPTSGASASTPVAIPNRPMTRAEFDTMMTSRFGVASVQTGTLPTQVDALNRGRPTPGSPRRGDLLGQLVAAGTLTWAAWNPGASSELYNGIAQGMEDFARGLGGIPPVNEIIFYRADYEETSTPPGLTERRDVGATYSGGTMTVFEAAGTTPKRMPQGRDEPGSPAPRPDPGVRESMANYTAHELGHGLQEVGLTPPAPTPGLMRDYGAAVGWIGARLFDIADPQVRQAVRSGQPPAGATPITRANWADSRWGEQPISAYMTESPFEDFPEAVMAFVRAPGSLQARSPHRFAFIEAHRSLLTPHLRAVAMPQVRPDVGDFPAPPTRTRVA